MKNYIYLDGKKVEISQESADSLKEQFKETVLDRTFAEVGRSFQSHNVMVQDDYVLVPLPWINDEWAFNAFEYARKFIRTYNQLATGLTENYSGDCAYIDFNQNTEGYLHIRYGVK